jgi:hypothetical protein
VSQLGVPSRNITRVPTLITNDGKLLVGNDVRKWIEMMKPDERVDEYMPAGLATSMLDESDENTAGDLFDLDNFHMTLAPQMTRELEEKISRKVTDAYQKGLK